MNKLNKQTNKQCRVLQKFLAEMFLNLKSDLEYSGGYFCQFVCVTWSHPFMYITLYNNTHNMIVIKHIIYNINISTG